MDAVAITPEFLDTLTRNQTEPVAFYSRGLLNVVFCDPSEVFEVLVSKSDSFLKGEQEAAISAAIGWGLLTEEDSSHKEAQKAISPALRAEAMRQYSSATRSVSAHFISTIRTQGEFHLLDTVRRFTQESAERSLFAIQSGPTDFRYHEVIMAINELVVGGSGSESDGRAAIAGLRRYSKHREFIQDHVRALIAEWRLSRWGGASLISYLAGLADPDEDGFGPFHQQVSLFLQASVETTASLLSWTLLLLARHPGYWDMLAEAQTASKHGTPEGDSSRRLMDAMLNESLRLYPPAWLLPRIARHDVRIGGVTVPSGARVIVSPWVTQRRENVFEDPLSFRPERWLKDDSRIARGGYFPFGLGNRICIGERYGKMTATIFLRQMVEARVKPHVENPDLSVGSSAIILNVGHDVRISLTQQLP